MKCIFKIFFGLTFKGPHCGPLSSGIDQEEISLTACSALSMLNRFRSTSRILWLAATAFHATWSSGRRWFLFAIIHSFKSLSPSPNLHMRRSMKALTMQFDSCVILSLRKSSSTTLMSLGLMWRATSTTPLRISLSSACTRILFPVFGETEMKNPLMTVGITSFFPVSGFSIIKQIFSIVE